MPQPYGIPVTPENATRLLQNLVSEQRARQTSTIIQRHREMQLLSQMLELYTEIQRVLDTVTEQGDSFSELTELTDTLFDPVRYSQFREKTYYRQRATLLCDTLANPLAPLRRGLRNVIRKRQCRHGGNGRWLDRHDKASTAFDLAGAFYGGAAQVGVKLPTVLSYGANILNPLSAILPATLDPLASETRNLLSPLFKLISPLSCIPRMLINYPVLLALYELRDRYADRHNPGCACINTLLPEIIASRERLYFDSAVGHHSLANIGNKVACVVGSPPLGTQTISPSQRARMLLANAVGEAADTHGPVLSIANGAQWKGCPLAMLILAALCATSNPRMGAKKAVIAMCAREETAVAAIVDYM